MRSWVHVFLEETESDWKLVKFQPLLMTAMFVAGVLLLVLGQLGHVQADIDHDRALGLMPSVWVPLLVGSPVGWAVTTVMIQSGEHRTRKWGLALRFGADVIGATALCAYTVTRLIVQPYVMSCAVLAAASVFMLSIVRRDLKEMLAHRRGGQ